VFRASFFSGAPSSARTADGLAMHKTDHEVITARVVTARLVV
jgi:hypothetical protein